MDKTVIIQIVMYKTLFDLLQGNVGVIDTTAVLESMACLLPTPQEDTITLDAPNSPVSEIPHQSEGEAPIDDKVTGDDATSVAASDQSEEAASEVPTPGGENVLENEPDNGKIEGSVERDEETVVDSTDDLQQSSGVVERVTSNVDVSEGVDLSSNDDESERNSDIPE